MCMQDLDAVVLLTRCILAMNVVRGALVSFQLMYSQLRFGLADELARSHPYCKTAKLNSQCHDQPATKPVTKLVPGPVILPKQ